MIDDAEFRNQLDVWDVKLAAARNVLEDVEMIVKKRQNFCRHNCPHTETYIRSVMGRDTENRCRRCNIEV